MAKAVDEDSLVSRIVARPDDMKARQAYAKWLTARGDIRGEAIELMLRPKLDKRGQERLNVIFEEASNAIEADITKYGAIAFIERGLVERVIVAVDVLVKHGPRWFAQHPIKEIQLPTPRKAIAKSLRELGRAPFAAKIRALEIDVCNADVSVLWDARGFTGLEYLHLTAIGVTPAPNTLKKIGQLRAPKLQSIKFYCVENVERALQSLAASTTMPKLKTIMIEPGGGEPEEERSIKSLRSQFGTARR